MIKEDYEGTFFVWTKNGRRPRYFHDTQEKAEIEAQRLAALNPGSKFIVGQFITKHREPVAGAIEVAKTKGESDAPTVASQLAA
jgi:hypothetical protein